MLFNFIKVSDARAYTFYVMTENVFVYFREGCIYVESWDTFTVIKQTSTGFNDRTAKYKEEFVPLLQPVIIHNEGDR